MSTLRLVLRYLWSLPGTLIGLVLAVACLPWGFCWTRGVLWVRTVWLPWYPQPRAQAWGVIVLCRASVTRVDVLHELVHVWQWMRWGPVFLLAYPAAALVAWTAGEHYYRDNYFEEQARAVVLGADEDPRS